MLQTNNNNNSLHQIEVHVDTDYLPERSDPENDLYIFNYTITLRNQGERPARLLGRHWIVTDSNGKIVRAIKGHGVVGEHPELEPGGEFRYTSGAILNTPIGAMQGGYQMIADNGDQFFAPIEAFRLAVPSTIN